MLIERNTITGTYDHMLAVLFSATDEKINIKYTGVTTAGLCV